MKRKRLSAQDLYERAREAVSRGRSEHAIELCEKAIAGDSRHGPSRTLLAMLRLAQDRHADVLDLLSPLGATGNATVQQLRLRALLALDRLEEAHQAIVALRAIDASSPTTYEQESELLRRRGDLEGALHAIDGAIALDGKRATAHAARAELLVALGRSDEAIASFAHALRTPAEARVLRGALERMAALFEERGESARAEEARGLLRSIARPSTS